MAYRRSSLSIRATLLARRSNPSFSYLSHYNDRKKSEESQSSGSKMETLLTQRRSFGSCVSQAFRRTPHGQLGRTPFGLQGIDRSLRRQMSTSSEVAIAAADSAFPSAVVQHFIDGVHCFTGLNWWASIAIATLLARVATLPLAIRTLRVDKDRGLTLTVVDELQPVTESTKKKTDIFIQSGLPRTFAHNFTSWCFYFAIDNMAKKVPSFTTGGALWFTDLSTPDAMCIFPVSLALIFLYRWETCWMMVPKWFRDDYNAIVTRGFAALLIPLTMFFPKAVLCSWITSSMFNCCVSLAFRNPGVQKLFDIPPNIIIFTSAIYQKRKNS